MAYRFCPQCAGRLALRQHDRRHLLTCPECGWVFYNNSAPCVGVMVVRERAGAAPPRQAPEVLLVKRAVEPFKGWWDVPGGFLEGGEHPADGARREVREETGLAIEPTEVVGFFMDVYGSEAEPTLNICYLAEIVGGKEQPADDAEELAWFPLDDLPEKIAFSWIRPALEKASKRLLG